MMNAEKLQGWHKLLEGYPWFECDDCFKLPAYSEFMPAPLTGQKPLGKTDPVILDENDPFGFGITELEEEYELRPGISHIGLQIMHSLLKLGRALPEHHIHGHGNKNLENNPYWPSDVSAAAGKLSHERYVTLLPMMLSRTQDDKGRVTWTFFGNTIHDPEYSFWKGFYKNPGEETDSETITSFFLNLLSSAYGTSSENSLTDLGFRILPVSAESMLPQWTKRYILSDRDNFGNVRFLLTFRPFENLPAPVKDLYISGKLSLLPFPGSLVFFGMTNYKKLGRQLPEANQLPLLRLVTRNRGIGSLRVPQTGWFYEHHPDKEKPEINEQLILNSFHRTHRWQRIHRYQDELNESVEKVKIAKALYSTESDHLGLYDKPMARNCHIFDHNFSLVLNGPKADRKKIYDSEKVILAGGLFGYRFFYPPMRTGKYSIYWHRPLVGFLKHGTDEPSFLNENPAGYIACYHDNDIHMASPVELWPRIKRREMYLSALIDFRNGHDHYQHQTSKNIISLLEAHRMHEGQLLPRSYAQTLLNLSKHKTLEQWLDELAVHTQNSTAALKMRTHIESIIEPSYEKALPDPLTYGFTANREFEEAWWNDIRFLAHGEFINKDNADVITDHVTRSVVKKSDRDIEYLGNYFLNRHTKAIEQSGMKGKAFCGELPFKWETDFEYALYGGWMANQSGYLYERNIIVVIPGKNRKEAVVFGDHYDTAYMEDVYEKSRGGSGARVAANGADDNYSASTTLLLAAPIFLEMAKEGKLERDIWLIHLTGEEFPSDCMGARNLCKTLIERNTKARTPEGDVISLADTKVVGVYVMDMIGHNRDNDHNVFQISPGKSEASLQLARQAHTANMIWNRLVPEWNKNPDRSHLGRGERITGDKQMPDPAKHLAINGEVRTQYNPHSSIFNTDGQIFSDTGVPVVLFMENYDISRQGYHDTHDTMENIDLDYGSAFAAIAIETVARVASGLKPL